MGRKVIIETDKLINLIDKYIIEECSVILPAIFEPPVRTFGATIPVFESQLFQ